MNTNTVEGKNDFYIFNIKPNACPSGRLINVSKLTWSHIWAQSKDFQRSYLPFVSKKIKHISDDKEVFMSTRRENRKPSFSPYVSGWNLTFSKWEGLATKRGSVFLDPQTKHIGI